MPDYADFADPQTYGKEEKKKSFRNPLNSWRRGSVSNEEDNKNAEMGWSAGVRVCFPSASVDSRAMHGSVVLWGTALLVVSHNAADSVWSCIWKAKELKDRRLLRQGGAQSDSAEDGRAGRVHVGTRVLALHVEVMGMGLVFKEAYCAQAMLGITFLVVEDDIRFSRGDTELVELSDGIGVGCACSETEFYQRYTDLTFSAQRAGVRVCVVLRADAASPDEAMRLARKLRFTFCTADERTCDHITAPLSAMFASEGGVVRVGSEPDSVASLVKALQRSQAKPLPPCIQELVNKSCSNPTGVIFHINQMSAGADINGVRAIDQVLRAYSGRLPLG